MGETCPICQRPDGDLQQWFDGITGPYPAASTICGRGSINTAADVECYRIGYQRSQEALAAARLEIAAQRATIAWACGEAPLPDGRWFDPVAFGHIGSVPRYWWRGPLRLYSALGAPAAAADEEDAGAAGDDAVAEGFVRDRGDVE